MSNEEMTVSEAERILKAFESGYIEPDSPDLKKAQEVTGKYARVSKYQSPSNPNATLEVRVVT